jgi:acrylyl-CoA reductase (NADPH)
VDLKTLDEISHEINLADAVSYAEKLMAGNLRGRVVVNVNQ